jgi:hypothetical protein
MTMTHDPETTEQQEPTPDETPVHPITIGDDATTETDGAPEPEEKEETPE